MGGVTFDVAIGFLIVVGLALTLVVRRQVCMWLEHRADARADQLLREWTERGLL